MKFAALIFSIITFSISASALQADNDPYKQRVWGKIASDRMKAREAKIVKSCFTDKEWSKVTPTISTKAEIVKMMGEPYNSGKLDQFAVTPLFMTKELGEMFASPVFNMARFPGAVLLERVITHAHNIPDLQQTNAFQRACLAKCITANIIDYDDAAWEAIAGKKGVKPSFTTRANAFAGNLADMLLPAAYAVNGGVGVCREFSKIYNIIANTIGVRSITMTGPRHAFNVIIVDKQLHYMEPQDPDCNMWK